MLTAAIVKAFYVYGVAIAISAVVALLIKAMVSMTGRLEKARKADARLAPQGTVCPVGPGVPDEDVAALSAAISAMIGPHHILHIAETSHRWASGARSAQHSHAPGHR